MRAKVAPLCSSPEIGFKICASRRACTIAYKSHKLAIAMILTVLRRDDADVRIETIAWILSVLPCIF